MSLSNLKTRKSANFSALMQKRGRLAPSPVFVTSGPTGPAGPLFDGLDFAAVCQGLADAGYTARPAPSAGGKGGEKSVHRPFERRPHDENPRADGHGDDAHSLLGIVTSMAQRVQRS